MLNTHFAEFRRANPGWLHFAAHSHHPWPDCTREAHARYWTDSAGLADRRRVHVLGNVLHEAQAMSPAFSRSRIPVAAFARTRTRPHVGAPHSALDWSRPVKVLTSAHEFHSFGRQTRRPAETGRLELTQVPAEPYETFTERFVQASASGDWDMVWLSHVFFVELLVQDLPRIVACAHRQMPWS